MATATAIEIKRAADQERAANTLEAIEARLAVIETGLARLLSGFHPEGEISEEEATIETVNGNTIIRGSARMIEPPPTRRGRKPNNE